MEPKSLLDPTFRYTPSFATNVKSTFDRIRRQLRAQQRAAQAPAKRNVVCLDRNSAVPKLQANC
jgi:hypothetical protein